MQTNTLKKTLTILLVHLTLLVFGQDPSDNIIPRESVDTPPDDYPDGVYLMDTEKDPDWNWPEDAGVLLGLKESESNSRHSQILIDRYGHNMKVRGKNLGNNEWTAWKK